MFIPKRWLVPAGLSMLLFAMILGVGLSGFVPKPGGEALDIAARASGVSSSMSDESRCGPPEVVAEPVAAAALTPQQEADIRWYLQALEGNKTVVITDAATNSGEITNSQFTDGGFGDIGQQWREVEIAAPVTNVHISGTGNVTTVVVGDGNQVIVGEAPVTETPPSGLTPELTSSPPVEVAPPVVEAPAGPSAPVTTVEATPVVEAAAA